MITSLRLRDFKNFGDETVRMGPFTVIVGANASGKSNIRDALRFLHGVGRGYTLADILGGKYGPGGEVQWDGLRGAPTEVARIDASSFAIGVEVSARTGGETKDLSVVERTSGAFNLRGDRSSEQFRVVAESLRFPQAGGVVYDSHPGWLDPVHEQDDETHLLLRMGKTGSQKKYGHRVAVRPDQPALTQIREHKNILRRHKEQADAVARMFARMRFLDPSPDRMRESSFPGQTVLGDQGNNLPTVLKSICEDSGKRKTLIEWTRELTPMDVEDFVFRTDLTTGKVQLLMKEKNGRTISAHSASDGTLRFLAVLSALLGEDQAELYFFEEIDNGIHPSRLRLLLEFIEERTASGAIQVVTTTHSSGLLAMLNDKTFQNTAVVCRQPNTDDAVVRQVADLPKASELRKNQGLDRLHASGWFEDAIFLNQASEEEQDRSEAHA